MGKNRKEWALISTILVGLTLGYPAVTVAEDIKPSLILGTAAAISTSTGEIGAYQYFDVLSFRKIVDVQGGWFITTAVNRPAGGLAINLKEAVLAFGGEWQCKLPKELEPEIGCALTLDLNNTKKFDVILHGTFLKLKF